MPRSSSRLALEPPASRALAATRLEESFRRTEGAVTPTARRFLADNLKEYIEKPFDAANLRAIVQRHLRANN
jgi:CheY-like chemotaxis protein